MAKRLKTITAGPLVAGVCYTAPAVRDGPQERQSKAQMSSAAQERVNLRRSWQKLEMLLAANFGPRDLHVVFTYGEAHLPPTRAGAVQHLRRMIRLLRAHRRARGQPTRYVYITEQLSAEGGRLHHHMVLNGTGDDLEVLRSLWRWGQVEVERLDLWQGYEAMAKYLTKEPREVGRPEPGVRSWSAALGLTKPRTESESVPDTVTIAAPPGAIILDRREEHNEWGDYLYLKYLMPDRKEEKKGARPPRRKADNRTALASCSGLKHSVSSGKPRRKGG